MEEDNEFHLGIQEKLARNQLEIKVSTDFIHFNPFQVQNIFDLHILP
mgnify:CR=1 FL=1